jgi:quercetin dioxygenase-like cupin family protein
MTASIRALPQHGHNDDGWLQIAPGERFKIRISSKSTNDVFTAIEFVADPGNGVPTHVHQYEDEHFVVLEGVLRVANADTEFDAPAGTTVSIAKGIPHTWCNPSPTIPLRILVVFSPGHIEGLFRGVAGLESCDAAMPGLLTESFGTKLLGPPPQEARYSIDSMRVWPTLP